MQSVSETYPEIRVVCPYPDGPLGNRHANTNKGSSNRICIRNHKCRNRCCKSGKSCGHRPGRSMEISSKPDQVTTHALTRAAVRAATLLEGKHCFVDQLYMMKSSSSVDSISCSLIPLTSPTCTKLFLSGTEIIATFANSHRYKDIVDMLLTVQHHLPCMSQYSTMPLTLFCYKDL